MFILSKIQKKIKKEDVERYPLLAYGGEVVVIRDLDNAQKAVLTLSKEKVMGFDIESQPSFKKGESHPPALIQLAGKEKVYIFQLKAMGGIGPVKKLLESPKILKVGVAIRDDVKKLFEIEVFDHQEFEDIADITEDMGIENKGLRNLVAIFLKKRVSKSMRTSNWGKEKLSPKQLIYAATDAWVSRELYFRVKEYEKGK